MIRQARWSGLPADGLPGSRAGKAGLRAFLSCRGDSRGRIARRWIWAIARGLMRLMARRVSAAMARAMASAIPPTVRKDAEAHRRPAPPQRPGGRRGDQPDGRPIATASADGNGRLWRIPKTRRGGPGAAGAPGPRGHDGGDGRVRCNPSDRSRPRAGVSTGARTPRRASRPASRKRCGRRPGSMSYCGEIPHAPDRPGDFHRLCAEGRVRWPVLTTQSRYDRAAGTWYPLAARAAGQVAYAAGLPKYGGVGS
jgi:hypothetical protein